jgi:hypothetical protein
MVIVSDDGRTSSDILLVVTTPNVKHDYVSPEKLTHWVLSRLPRHHPSTFTYKRWTDTITRNYEYKVRCESENVAYEINSEELPYVEGAGIRFDSRLYVAIRLGKETGHRTLNQLCDAFGRLDDTPSEMNTACISRSIQANCCSENWLRRTLGKFNLPGESVAMIHAYLDSYPDFIQENMKFTTSALRSETMAHCWSGLQARSLQTRPYELQGAMGICFDDDDTRVSRFTLGWHHDVVNPKCPITTREDAIREMDRDPTFQWYT